MPGNDESKGQSSRTESDAGHSSRTGAETAAELEHDGAASDREVTTQDSEATVGTGEATLGSDSEPSESVSERAPTDADEPPDSGLFIVGVGASAGGLEALTALIKHANLESAALVIVQHLARTHESFLPALLGRTSNVQVVSAEDGMRVEPNHIYVIPPNADLAILQGVLHLFEPPAGPGARLPIDYFFRSLAADRGTRAIGVVLSGTGSDGTFGLKAIKEAGGLTFVQEPGSAKYDGMPRSALESGWADF